MRRFILSFIAALLAVAATGCWEKSIGTRGTGPLYRAHFAGVDAMLKDNKGTNFQRIWKLPVSTNLREETLQKLARAPFEFWKATLPAGASDESALIKPLLDDLVKSESVLEVQGTPEKPETALAIKLTAERAGTCQK